MSKRYDVLAPRKKKDGGTFWHRVGTAWEGEEGINITFDSLPLPDSEGRVSVSLFEPREDNKRAGKASGKPMSEALDDTIPF